MGGSFAARMDNLIEQVGPGKLTARVHVDQVYAKYQELRDDLKLHRGGEHHYLRNSLMQPLDDHLMRMARGLVTADGSEIRQAVADVADAVARGVLDRAPLEFFILKQSAAATAADNGAIYHDVPATVRRLTEDELRRLRTGDDTAADAARRTRGEREAAL